MAAPASAQGGTGDIVAQHSTDYIAQGKLLVASGTTVDTTKYKKTPPYKITYVIWSVDNSFNVQQKAEIDQEASLYPEVKFTSEQAGGDANKQISMIEDAITAGADAIITDPIDQNALAPVAEKAQAAGIPLIAVTDLLDSPAVTSSVLNDDLRFGQEISTWLIQTLNCKGNLIVLNGQSGNSTSDDREKGLTDAIAACPNGGKDVKILAKNDAEWAYDQGKSATAQMLAAFPQIDGVWSQGGAMSQGAIDAFTAANRPLVPMTGENSNGYLLEWQKLIPSGFKSVAATTPTWMARVGLQVALKILQGLPVDKNYVSQGAFITADNLAQFVKPNYNDSYWAGSLLPQAVADQLYLKH